MDLKSLFFSFEGRINRAKWWLSILIFVIAATVIWLAILPVLGFSVWRVGGTTSAALISLIVFLVFAYPATAVMVKRLNDRDRPMVLVAIFWTPSVLGILAQLFGIGYTTEEMAGQMVPVPTTIGWFINLLSLVIGIWAFVELGCLKGTPGANRHGPDPLAAPAAAEPGTGA